MLTVRGLGTVLGDLAALGYDARWCVLGACDAGAPHKRERIWIVAEQRGLLPHTQLHGTGWRQQQQEGTQKKDGGVADAMRDGSQGQRTDRNATGPTGLRSGTGRDQEQRVSWWDIDPADLGNAAIEGLQKRSSGSVGQSGTDAQPERSGIEDGEPRPAFARLGRVAHGVAHRVDRLKAIGNGQVSAVVRLAWNTLMEGVE